MQKSYPNPSKVQRFREKVERYVYVGYFERDIIEGRGRGKRGRGRDFLDLK